jgi:imidazolonepropionase-like amidohydrolase
VSRFRSVLLAALVCCAALSFQPAPPETLIAGATLVDGTGAQPFVGDLLIRGDRIAAIAPHIAPPSGARVIDGKGHALLPGIFDVHTHVRYSTAGPLQPDWGKNLKAYLYCGVTSLADFGTYGEAFEPVRKLIRTGVFEAPRVSFAYRLTTPGGHGAEGGRGDIFSYEVLTPRQARAAMKRILPYRPDAIKVFTDGWRYGFDSDMTNMEEDTLAAIVDEAHAHNIPVLTHTVTLGCAKIAARAKVDVVAHGIGDAPADAELMELMKKSGTMYAPTLAVYESKKRGEAPDLARAVLEPEALKSVLSASGGAAPSAARARRWKNLMGNTAALRSAGIVFTAGTDAGMSGTYHGYASLHELELLAQGGLTPLEAITAATGNSARALRATDRGTLAVGKLADLVLIQGEPQTRIADIMNVRRVWLGGREIDREKLRREIALPGVTPIPAAPAPELLDDLESPDGRSRIGTLWVNSTDAGHDHTFMSFVRTLRAPGNHAMTVLARMGEKDRPYARVHLPLTPGAVAPLDANAYAGIAFESRGEGEYRLTVLSRTQRSGPIPSATFRAEAAWRPVRVAWSELQRAQTGWSAKELTDVAFEITRPAGEKAWLEIDNVRLYR